MCALRALVRLEVGRAARYLRAPLALATVMLVVGLYSDWDHGELALKLCAGVLLLFAAPGSLTGRDKLDRTLVLLKRLPVNEKVIVTAKFVAAMLATVPIAALGAGTAMGLLALSRSGTVIVFLAGWTALTLLNWLAIGLILRIEPENFGVALAIGIGSFGALGYALELMDVPSHLRRAVATGSTPAILFGVAVVAGVVLAGVACHLATAGIRRYDPRCAR